MKPKSKSLTAILALTSATVATSTIARAETNEGGGLVEEDGAATSIVKMSSSSSLTESQLRRPKQRTRPVNGQTNLAREKQAVESSSTASTTAAPGCGPTPGTHHSPYLGCYIDRSSQRAFPFELHANKSRAKRLGHGALDCERECTDRGYRYFGREFRGQCFCGNVLERIEMHGLFNVNGGRGGCDCCGGNVGSGRVCVWENAYHQDSHAQPPDIPAIQPQQSQQVSTTVTTQSLHSYITTSSNTNNNNSNQHKPNNNNNSNNQVTKPASTSSTRKPTGAFRLRLHWEPGYKWQGNFKEKYFCMQCRGSCRSGSSLQVDRCDTNSVRQKFIAVGSTIRAASNPSLCATVGGYNGKKSPVKLRPCKRGEGSDSQSFKEVRAEGKFELQPSSNSGRCLSQHHHPKEHEVVFPEVCSKTREFDTTYWTTY